MPLFLNNGLDDPLLLDQCQAFVGGQVSFTRPHLIGPTQAAQLVNIDIAQNGIARTRRGIRVITEVLNFQPIQAICFYDVPILERLIVVAGNELFEYDLDADVWSGANPITADTSNVDYPVDVVQGIDTIYVGVGGEGVYKWVGVLQLIPDAPPGSLLLWFTNRLFIAGIPDVPDQLDASDFLDAESWNSSTQSIRIGAGEGDPIIALAPWIGNRLVVLKRGSIWLVDAEPTAPMGEWTVELVHRRIGCVAKRTVVQVGQDIWFLSDSGVRSLAKTVGTDLNAVGPSLSFPIQDLIDRINFNYIEKATAIFWNNRYLLSVPLDSSTYPNYVIVYNTDTQSWSGYWTGWNASALAITAFGGQARLFIGRQNGDIAKWLDYVPSNTFVTGMYEDGDSGGYISQILTRAMQFGEPLNNKHGQHFEIEFQESEANATISIIRNQTGIVQAALTDITTPSDDLITLPIDLPFDLIANNTKRRATDMMQFDVFREVQFKVRSEEGLLAVRAITATAFLDTMEMEIL